MATTQTTVPGQGGQVDAAAIQSLRAQLQGSLLAPDDEGYDDARSIWNAMIDRRPALIVQCNNADDVVAAVTFARKHDLLVAVKGGGHNIAGNAVCNGGLMIDLSQMRAVEVDAQTQRARVQPGATLADLDAATQAHGLATPVGINSTTGVAGLTLGGGFGWLSRKYGLTIDNLVSADIVTADGTKHHASAAQNSDLFWAIRGGGGNFGIVTQFEYQLHPIGTGLLSGLIVYPFDDAKSILTQYRAVSKDAPEELSAWLVLRKAPPLPFLPEEVHGKEVVVVALLYAGDAEEGERVIAPLFELGTPVGTHVEVMPYVGWQQAFDPLLTPGARNYWKSHNINELSDGFFDTLIEYVNRLPSPHCEIFVAHLGGAINRVPADATPYVHRENDYLMNVHGRWETPAEDAAVIGWSRALFDAVKPHAAGSVYVNFMPEDETDRVAAAYGNNYARLAQIKQQVDPDNLFRMNQNIKPAG